MVFTPFRDEQARLAAVRRYDILDTPPDGAFDRITALASRHFGAPIAIVSIVDADRIWFKSNHGIEDVREIGRDPGLCASAIMQHDTWVVEDAASDPRSLANPLVAGALGLRFYAGAPLRTTDGHNLGTLCVIDHEPREFGEEDQRALADMAAIVMDELELRLAARRALDHEHEMREQAESVARTLQASLLPPRLPELPGADLAAFYHPAAAKEIGGDFYDIFLHRGGGWTLMIGDISGKGTEAAAKTAFVRYTARTAATFDPSPDRVLQRVNAAMLDYSDTGLDRFCTLLVAHMTPEEGGVAARVATAGHPRAVVVGTDGRHREAGGTGPLAGIYDDATYVTEELTLRPGDAFLAYTDGVTDLRGAGLATITPAMIADALATAPRGAPAAALLAAADEALLARGPRDDDAAAVLITIAVAGR